jgi:hypothetical protein
MGSVPPPTTIMPQAYTGHGAPLFGLNPDNKNSNININNMNNMNNVSSMNIIDTKERDKEREKDRDRENIKEPLRSNRLLVATTSGFADLDVIESVGLGLGAGGCVAVGSGRHVNIFNENIGTAFGAVKHHTNSTGNTGYNGSTGIVGTEFQGSDGRVYTDMEYVMRNRCMKGYSIDAGRNLQVLSDELDFMISNSDGEVKKSHSLILKSTSKIVNDVLDPLQTPLSSSSSSSSVMMASNSRNIEKKESNIALPDLISPDEIQDLGTLNSTINQKNEEIPSMRIQVLSLTRLWAWVDRVESRNSEGLSVSYCGTINLLASTTTTSPTLRSIHTQLNVAVYTSDKRNLAKELCGWTKMPSTDAIVEKVEVQKSKLLCDFAFYRNYFHFFSYVFYFSGCYFYSFISYCIIHDIFAWSYLRLLIIFIF